MNTSNNFKIAILALIALTSGNALAAERVISHAEITATIESVNMETRQLVLTREDGKRVDIVAGPEVRNLAQVNAGDTVLIEYEQSIAADILPPGSSQEKAVAGIAARANEGEMPAIGQIVQALVTVTVDAIDLENSVVTITEPEGLQETVFVESPEGREFIKQLKVGDLVDITYTEGFAISVQTVE